MYTFSPFDLVFCPLYPFTLLSYYSGALPPHPQTTFIFQPYIIKL